MIPHNHSPPPRLQPKTVEHYVSKHASLRMEYGSTMYGTLDSSPSQTVKATNQQASIGYAYHF